MLFKLTRNSILSVLLFFSLSFGQTVQAEEPIDEIRYYIDNYYVNEVSDSVLNGNSPDEILENLDQHSTYFTPEEFKQFFDDLNRSFVGIGVTIEKNEKGILLVSVFKDSPAEEAGLIAGDIITEVDGTSLVGKSTEEAATLIKGKAGTKTNLKIIRQNTNSTFQVTVTRQVISVPTAEYERLSGNIGYIRLYSFNDKSQAEMLDAIEKLGKVNGWIIDFRDNGGGYVTTAQEVGGFFKNVDNAYLLKNRVSLPTVFPTILQSKIFEGPVHLLINGNSASASEMVAAAVKEEKAAVLYGQTTYGKGTMQQFFEISDGSALKLTTSEFFSPKGEKIDGVGVVPDKKTAYGVELLASHYDLLRGNLSKYTKLATLSNVSIDKTFTIQMSQSMKWSQFGKQDVQLYQIGGKEVELDLKSDGTDKVIATPKEKLEPGETYFLVINPKWQGNSGKTMSRGSYVEVYVKE
ncbi:S41 family peptidase [Cytobacillus suaedae]|nr:S41 family peptidase [Cytobacillus suaedae]